MTDSELMTYPRIRLSLLQKNVNLTMTRFFRTSGHDLTREQEAILRELSERDGVNQVDLAAKVGQDRNNLSRTLTLLASKALIERDVDDNDRRKSIVRITEAGRTLHCEVYKSVNEYRRILFSGFSQEEIQVFAEMIKRLNGNLETYLGNAGMSGSEGSTKPSEDKETSVAGV